MADQQPMTGHPSQAPMSQHPSHMTQQPNYGPQPGTQGQIQFDTKPLLGTLAGKLKIASAVLGLLAMAFCAGVFNHQELPKNYGSYTCPSSFFECPQQWAAQMALAFVIIAWLFSIFSLIVTVLPSLSQNPMICQVDGFGHIGAAVLTILGFLLCILWVVNGFVSSHCEKFDGEKASICMKMVFITYTFDSGPYGSQTLGEKNVLWIIGGLCALAQGIVCIVIFLQLKKGTRPGMGMRMMTGNPSQAPMSQHPSQMTQQQQNPEQGSVHPDPSKQTQQE